MVRHYFTSCFNSSFIFWLDLLISSAELIVIAVLFNGLFSGTTWVSWRQTVKLFWILMKQEMTGWQ